MEEESEGRSSKRLKRSHEHGSRTEPLLEDASNRPLHSLSRSITPPPKYRRQPPAKKPLIPYLELANHSKSTQIKTNFNVIPSPVQLTHIRDLSENSGHNPETVRLSDILGDPLIKQCWQFNFLFDVDFLMNQFDLDVKSLVKVKVVHGSWKKDAPNRIRIDVRCVKLLQIDFRYIETNNLMIGSLFAVSKRRAYCRIYAGAIWYTPLKNDDINTP